MYIVTPHLNCLTEAVLMRVTKNVLRRQKISQHNLQNHSLTLKHDSQKVSQNNPQNHSLTQCFQHVKILTGKL